MKQFVNLIKNIDKFLLLFPLVFACVSILMMLTISGGRIFSSFVVMQTTAFLLGYIAIFIIANIDYSMFADWTKPLYIASVILLLLPYVPGLGMNINNAQSWINLRFMTLQPSELVKISYTLFVASYLTQHKDDLYNLKNFAKMVGFTAPVIVLLLKEDFGSAAIFSCMWLSMVLYVGVEKKLFRKLVLAVCIIFPIAYQFLATYQKNRITAFLYPDDLSNPATRQVFQAKVAMGSGGFLGKGLFNGEQSSLNFLPVKESDFIFAVLVEQLGFIGGVLLIALFAFFIYKIFKLSFVITDTYGALIVISFSGMFLAQTIENIGMSMGVMPVTGITLPFISYGGSSVLANMIAMGLVVSVSLGNKSIEFESLPNEDHPVKRSKIIRAIRKKLKLDYKF